MATGGWPAGLSRLATPSVSVSVSFLPTHTDALRSGCPELPSSTRTCMRRSSDETAGTLCAGGAGVGAGVVGAAATGCAPRRAGCVTARSPATPETATPRTTTQTRERARRGSAALTVGVGCMSTFEITSPRAFRKIIFEPHGTMPLMTATSFGCDAASRRSFTVNGLTLRALHWGRAGRPAICFLHGGSAHAHWFDAIAPAFADRYEVISLDQRGHGESDWPPPSSDDTSYATESFASDLLGVIDQLGWNEMTLCGHSMGGHNAMA